jgi:parallel beta-helix repeat protein
MDPDVSILSHGRVVARGTRDRPITFRRALERKPWGSVALQGEGANGSEFDHVRFTGGGGAFLSRVEYKGMVTVHWAKQITFKNCEFSDNVRSDDAINAVHSELTIERCTFRRANSDAVDFDYSSGKIINNHFEASGNDGIDLMGSAPQIIGNYITGSGDKGISIGEGSSPFVFNNYIARCNRGMEIKDASEPFLVHNTVTQNTIGILQSAKNWRYGTGGWGKLFNMLIVGNGTDIKSDRNSRLSKMASSVNTAGGQTPVTPGAGSHVSTDAVWVFAHYGLRARSNAPGQIDAWTVTNPILPRVSAAFKDDFEETADGWIGHRGVSRLEKRDQDLHVAFTTREGHVSRQIDWNLMDPRYRYVAVFELSGRDWMSGNLSVLADGSGVSRALEAPGDSAYRFFSLELQPGHYTAIRIAAVPVAASARIRLHTYRLYAIPKDEPVN